MLTDNPAAPLILVVEDDGNHAELIQRAFDDDRGEYRLVVAATVRAAKTAIEQESPSLVLTDYRLPDGEGSELVVVADGAWPVIVMTSHGSERVAVEAMKVGAQDYIVKSPESFENLPRTVKYAFLTWGLRTARRHADAAALRAKKDWERTFDAVPDLISIINLNHTITRVNKAMAKRFGLTPEELVGRKCCEVVHGLKIPADGCPVAGMMQDGLVHNVGIEEKRLNGYFDVTVSPMTDDEGRVTAFVHVMRDITSHRLAEEALKVNEGKYRKLANEQQIILNASSVGICLLKDRKVLWANPAFDVMFGYESGLTHNLDTEAFYYEKEVYDFIGENGYPTIDSGDIYSNDVMMKKKDGSLIWCNLVGQAVTPGKADDGSIWIMMDITERKRAEEERQNLERQLQHTQKLESLGVLSGGIAHDFNNILTIILGHCYILKEHIDSDVDRDVHLRMIESAANRAADLCRQMLAYAGKNPLVQSELNLWVLVDDIVKMTTSAINKNVTISLDMRGDIPMVMGDSSQIQQVVMNLIINAGEAIGDHNGTILVGLKKVAVLPVSPEEDYFGSSIIPGGYACLEVSDNGCGMSEETRLRVFEPFYTTKFTGRGLGMSAILGIVKAHNGSLQLTSAPGVGTTFRVFFPLSCACVPVESVPSVSAVSSAQSEATILLVDDEETLLKMQKTLLAALGFSVITAANGREALEQYKANDGVIDLVMLDLIMPEMGGIETYHELRKIDERVPIIICSGYGEEAVPEAVTVDDRASFLHKPYNPLELRGILYDNIMKSD